MMTTATAGDDNRPTCTFSRLVWSCDECGGGVSRQRAWATEQKHVSGAPTYDSRKYVIAKAARLVMVHQYASMCDGQPCIRTDAEHTLECMVDEGAGKFRVRRLAHGCVPYVTATAFGSRFAKIMSKFVQTSDTDTMQSVQRYILMPKYIFGRRIRVSELIVSLFEVWIDVPSF